MQINGVRALRFQPASLPQENTFLTVFMTETCSSVFSFFNSVNVTNQERIYKCISSILYSG